MVETSLAIQSPSWGVFHSKKPHPWYYTILVLACFFKLSHLECSTRPWGVAMGWSSHKQRFPPSWLYYSEHPQLLFWINSATISKSLSSYRLLQNERDHVWVGSRTCIKQYIWRCFHPFGTSTLLPQRSCELFAQSIRTCSKMPARE